MATAVDACFERHDAAFAHLRGVGDTTEIWKLWTQAFKQGLLQAAQLQHANGNKGRGLVILQEVWHTAQLPDTAKDIVTHGEVEQQQKEVVDGLRPISKAALLCYLYRKIRWAIDNIRLRPHQIAAQVSPQMHHTLVKLFLHHQDIMWRPAYDHFLCGQTTLPSFITTLRVAEAELQKLSKSATTQLSRAVTKAVRTAFTNPEQSMRRSFAAVRNQPQPPLIAIRHDGRMVCKPSELDAAHDQVWAPIFDAQGTTHPQRVARVLAFFETYERHVFRGTPFQVPPLTGGTLMHQARNSTAVAGGLDNLHPRELKLLPRLAWHRAAEMFTLIEEGRPWPRAALVARATFILKPDGDSALFTDFIILLLTSTLYRIWAKTRMRHLDP